jgi:UDP-GlcNAc:undecaprenyl-phosphate/decaprenyl-phosphate GlcNAc-1-phosphate transferase
MLAEPIILYILCFGVSLVISLFSVPQIISMAGKKQLFDLPDEHRKLHTHRATSNLGGIAIFFAYIITASIIVQPAAFDKWHYIVAASLLFFLTGMMDDLIALSPIKKLVAQLIPALIIAILADIRIKHLPGLAGELPFYMSAGLTTIIYLFTINAFNLIDGIDMLAGAMGSFYTLLLGIFLALTGNAGAACIAFSLAGATAGFLKYNASPAKIFMGDTGSLLLGFTITMLCVLLTNSYNDATDITHYVHSYNGVLLFCISLLSVPVFDCIRVFFLRIKKGVSPFHADRRHAHYYLTDMGFSHPQATFTLVLANMFIMGVGYLVQDAPFFWGMATVVAVASVLFGILYTLRRRIGNLP